MIMLPDSLGILVYLLSYVGPELLPVVVDRRELDTSKTVGGIFALDVDGESADAFDGGFDDFARLQEALFASDGGSGSRGPEVPSLMTSPGKRVMMEAPYSMVSQME